LEYATLVGAGLQDAKLDGSNWSYANEKQADFAGVQASNATFAYGVLDQAIFKGAALEYADFFNSSFTWLTFQEPSSPTRKCPPPISAKPT
jgi:uncharacterized protein YjbI with pentapeptide repeats